VKPQLRPQLARDARLRRREDEVDVRASSRLEFQRGAEHVLEASQPGAAVREPQRTLDRLGVVVAAGKILDRAQHAAAATLEFILKGGGDALAPVTLGYQCDRAATPFAERTLRDAAGFVFG